MITINKLTALIISAGLCFSLVSDAKTIKIPQWIFGFTFDAPVTVRRAQCKALKGMWNYGSDMCINPQLTGLGSECSKLDVFVGFVSGNTLPGMRQDRLWFLYPEDQSRKELLACHNKWLEWAHSSFGEPEKKDLYNCWWSKDSETDSPWADTIPKNDVVHVRAPYSDKGMWVWFSKSTHTPQPAKNNPVDKPVSYGVENPPTPATTIPSEYESVNEEALKERATQLYIAKIFSWLNTFISLQCGKDLPINTTKAAIFVKDGRVSGYKIGTSGNREFDNKVRAVMAGIFGQTLPPVPPLYPNILDGLKDNALGKVLYVNISGRSSPCRIVTQ